MPSIVPTIIERWTQGGAVGYDIFSRLLKERIIFIGGYGGQVTTDSADMIIAQLLYLDAEDPEKDISLYINSPGGMVTAGLAVYDTMQYIKSNITTVCIGMAMSFGALLLAAGGKGKRFALPHARIMVHQPLIYGGGLSGSATDIDIENKELMHTKTKLIEILAKHTGQSVEKVRQDTERNFYMSPEEAKAYGIIDEIMSFRKK
ncbi:MAG: ATP-dependent Clp protease proteolytic subunit [Elusimicrobia bacterium RIFOXYA2_FULL_39_19]|nr:MAG: ATP-dependent Clp protease proteolytic subunit [Elusimicrobia bacterium RIFOXYA2_FULL_39_19]